MDGKRRERRWVAVGFALVWGGASVGSAETATEARRTWLLIQEDVTANAVVEHEQRVRTALERLRSSQPIEVFMLRDHGFATFVATAHAEDHAGVEALDTLPRALLGLGLEASDAEVVAPAPPARLVNSRPQLSYFPRDNLSDRTHAEFYRYAFYRVPVAQVPTFEQVLERRRELFRVRNVRHSYDVLSGGRGDESQLFVLATGAGSRAELDIRSRGLRKQLGRAGWRLERAFEQIGQSAGALEGDLVLTWAGIPVEVRYATRGRPPGSWIPSAAILEPLSPAAVAPPAPVLVAVDEPLLPPIVQDPITPLPPTSTTSPSEGIPPEAGGLASAEAMVRDWAQAWSNKQLKAYLGHYAQVFQPPAGLSRNQWQAQLEKRLTRPKFIEVRIDDLEVEFVGPLRARATFTQVYRADHDRDEVAKRLELINERGRWRIQREEVLDL